MLEQIVRPFQSPQVLTTRRIVKSVSAPVATPPTAVLTWGKAGTIPAGVRQLDPATAGSQGGFSVVGAQEDWTQSGAPVTETVDVGGAQVKRVREIAFQRITDTVNANPAGLAAAAVSDVVSGLLTSIEGNRATRAKYKTKWN